MAGETDSGRPAASAVLARIAGVIGIATEGAMLSLGLALVGIILIALGLKSVGAILIIMQSRLRFSFAIPIAIRAAQKTL